MDGNLNHEICFPARRRLNLIPWETDLSCGRKQRMHQSRCFKHPGRSPFGSHPVFPVTSPAAACLALLKCGRFTVSYLPCLARVPVTISCRPIATPLYVMTLFQQDIFLTRIKQLPYFQLTGTTGVTGLDFTTQGVYHLPLY